MEIDAKTIYEGIKDDLANIATSVKMMLEKVPPELAKDIVHSGIYLSGGLDKRTIRIIRAFKRISRTIKIRGRTY